MWRKNWCFEMNEVVIRKCVCGVDVFVHKDGEHDESYEDLKEAIPHTKLRCEINQIISKRLGQSQIQINQIIERLNLD